MGPGDERSRWLLCKAKLMGEAKTHVEATQTLTAVRMSRFDPSPRRVLENSLRFNAGSVTEKSICLSGCRSSA